MRKLKNLQVLFLLLAVSNLYSLSLGFNSDVQVIKLKDSSSKNVPDVITNVETNIFLNIDFKIHNFFFEFAPALSITDKLQFKFQSFLALFATDFFTVSCSKKNIYFGNGLDVNPVFYNLPIKTAYKDNLWNAKFSYIHNYGYLTLGSIIDTEKIDKFKKPAWHNYFLTSLVSNENFALYCNVDFLFSGKNKSDAKELKLAAEFDFTKVVNLNLYVGVDYLIKFNMPRSNTYDVMTGASYFIAGSKVEHVYIFEAGVHNKKFFTSLCAQWNFFDLINLEERFTYIDESIYLSSSVIFEFNLGNLKVEYKSPNLKKVAERNDYFSISCELKGLLK
ncbi:MAG: hypothetical protein IJR50_05575 [Treponema sp.]|nr:hypothetical protein [Treponema sp.]